jgi:hypothetical protein
MTVDTSNESDVVLRCHSCGTEYAWKSGGDGTESPEFLFKVSVLMYGIIVLDGKEDGYLGITCTKVGCNTTILERVDKSIISAATASLFENGEYGPGYIRPNLRYDSFPFGLSPEEYAQESYRWRGLYPLANDRQFVERLEIDDFEILHPEIVDLYVSYSFGHLAIGPMARIFWYDEEDIEKNQKEENVKGVKLFPRYRLYTPKIESTQIFCYEHYLYRLYRNYLLGDPRLKRNKEELFPEDKEDIIASTDFFKILITSFNQEPTALTEECPDVRDEDDNNQGINEIEQQVSFYHDKGFGRDFLAQKYLEFIKDYIETSKKVEFSSQKAEELRRKYLNELHMKMKTESQEKKRYAFYEEPPAWTIIFNWDRIPALKGSGFKYLYYLVSHKGMDIPAKELHERTSSIPFPLNDENDASPDNEDKHQGKMWNPQQPLTNLAFNSDQQEVFDKEAIISIRKKLDEIDMRIEHAELIDNLEEKKKLIREKEALEKEWRRAQKPGSKQKYRQVKFKNDMDRLTDMIGTAINNAKDKIRKYHRKAGEHFDHSIKKQFSKAPSYKPSDSEDISWET